MLRKTIMYFKAMKERKCKDEILEFYPAALEIQTRPANKLSRCLSISLMSLFVLACLWLTFARIDISASAEGKILPSSKIKHIQNYARGVIHKIYVKQDQKVIAGEVLLELDQSETRAEIDYLEQQLSLQQLKYTRFEYYIILLRQLINSSKGKVQFDDQQVKKYFLARESNLSQEDLAAQLDNLRQQWRAYLAKDRELVQAIESNEKLLGASSANINAILSSLPILTKQVNAFQTLSDKGLAPEIQLLQIQQQLMEMEFELEAETFQLASLEATSKKLHEGLQSFRASSLANSLDELELLTALKAQLKNQLVSAKFRQQQQIIRAPVDGVIKDLAVNTLGAVVNEAQTLMTLVPMQDVLEVEALLPNKDIGFVKTGMNAEVKVHTYPFTKYGVVPAKLESVSKDAFEQQSQQPMYRLSLKLEKNHLQDQLNTLPLLPGMLVTVEIKTGSRRAIEFFLAPFLKARSESIRER